MKSQSELIIYAEANGQVIGIAPSYVADDGNVTVGVVAVAESFRQRGVATALMFEVEKQARVLKANGRYIMFDTHPFNRPFDDSGTEIKAIKDYDDTTGNHWRVADLYNAVISRGFEVLRIEEFHAEPGSHDLWFYKTIKEAETDGNSNRLPCNRCIRRGSWSS